MDNQIDKSLEDLVKKRAYEIWEGRCGSELWDYGRRGTEKGDYFQALYEIGKEMKNASTNTNSISTGGVSFSNC